MSEAIGAGIIAALAVLGIFVAGAGIRLWWLRRSWRKKGGW